MTSGVIRTTVRSRRPWRMISWPAANGIRWVKPSSATVPRDAVDEVIYGAANQAGEDNRNVARMAVLLSGLSDEIPGYTVNRLCASSLQAVASAAQQIRTGEADVVVAGGVESMTRAPVVVAKPARGWGAPPEMADTTLGWRLVNPRMRDVDGGLPSQRLTAAAAGQRKADLVEVALKNGALEDDEVPRPDTTAEALAKL